MTVATAGLQSAVLREVIDEHEGADEVIVALREKRGVMFADLKIGANVAAAVPLSASVGISNRGVIPHGDGMSVDKTQAAALGLGRVPGLELRLRPYRNGRDLTQTPRGLRVIDMYGLTAEIVRERFPEAYQWLLERVKPERDQNPRANRREKWWLFGENQPKMRESLQGLSRYLATVQTAKHRFFTFLGTEVLPDDKLIVIASDDASNLGVLSSTAHAVWALAAGSRLGVGNDPVYNKSTCFECFAFPLFSEGERTHLRNLGEQLDAHRKRQQAARSDLTLTGMYNVLDKLRSGEVLSAKERTIHEHGLVSVLRQLHDEIDAAVLEAYGWSDLLPLLRVAHGNDVPFPLPPGDGAPRGAGEDSVSRDPEFWSKRQTNASTEPTSNAAGQAQPLQAASIPAGERQAEAKHAFDEAILERLVALNAERAAEEARGLVRWLRPEFQNPSAQPAPEQSEIDTDTDSDEDAPTTIVTLSAKPQAWPKDAVEQVRAVADVLVASPIALSIDDIAARFTGRGPWRKRLPQLLEILVTLGRAESRDSRYSRGSAPG